MKLFSRRCLLALLAAFLAFLPFPAWADSAAPGIVHGSESKNQSEARNYHIPQSRDHQEPSKPSQPERPAQPPRERRVQPPSEKPVQPSPHNHQEPSKPSQPEKPVQASPPPKERAQPQPERTLYAKVQYAAAGTVYLGGARISSNSPWLPYLLPGMWVRALGRWNQVQFASISLEIVRPQRFAVYQGPGGLVGRPGGWIKVWYLPGTGSQAPQPIGSISVAAGAQASLLFYNGTRGPVGVPPPLLPLLGGLRPGWWILSGRPGAKGIDWQKARPFPTRAP